MTQTFFPCNYDSTCVSYINMKLRDYLKKRKLSIRAFAELGEWPYLTVYSWMYEDMQGKPRRIPDSNNMRKISDLTNNRVKPNDFY